MRLRQRAASIRAQQSEQGSQIGDLHFLPCHQSHADCQLAEQCEERCRRSASVPRDRDSRTGKVARAQRLVIIAMPDHAGRAEADITRGKISPQ
jgi:hypothetical protein